MTLWVVSEATSLSRCTVLPGTVCFLSSSVRSWSIAVIPLGTQLIDESSLLVHTVVMMHQVCDGNVHRQSHVGQLAASRIVIHLPIFSQQKKLIFV